MAPAAQVRQIPEQPLVAAVRYLVIGIRRELDAAGGQTVDTERIALETLRPQAADRVPPARQVIPAPGVDVRPLLFALLPVRRAVPALDDGATPWPRTVPHEPKLLNLACPLSPDPPAPALDRLELNDYRLRTVAVLPNR